MRRHLYIWVGYALIILFFFQEWLNLRWKYLSELQQDESFKRWSGLVLLIAIAFQWTLMLVRTDKGTSSRTNVLFYNIHKWLGSFLPVLFYIHAMKAGFAYQFFLSLLFLLNLLSGLVNIEAIKSRAKWYFHGWMIFHVSVSLLLSLLVLFHIWVVFYFE